MAKVIYIDTETTGLNPKKHGLTEVYAVLVDNGNIISEWGSKINPFTYFPQRDIEDDALNIQGISYQDLAKYPDQAKALDAFLKWTRRHLDGNRVSIVGYNVGFDIDFLVEWFDENVYDLYDTFSHRSLDVLDLVRHLQYAGVIQPKDGKLTTLCEYFDIPIDAHTAMGDVIATMQLHRELLRRHIGTYGEDEE